MRLVLQIYNLTFDVTVTSFQMGSTPNLDIFSFWLGKFRLAFRKMCVKFRFHILSRCHVIDADVKGGSYTYVPPPSGRWVRGGPAAAGLKIYQIPKQMLWSSVKWIYSASFHKIGQQRCDLRAIAENSNLALTNWFYWPGDLTLRHIELNFSRNVYKGCSIDYAQFNFRRVASAIVLGNSGRFVFI